MVEPIKYQPSNKWVGKGSVIPLRIDLGELVVPKWWHRLVFWKRYDYVRFNMESEYLKTKKLIRQMASPSKKGKL